MSGEVPSLVDLQNTKVRIDHFAELIDGTPSGTSTNPITGVTHPTYEQVVKDFGFKPGSGSFTTGFTINPGEYDVAWYDPVSKNWYSWGGVIPTGGLVVAPGTDPTVATGYVPRTDVVLRTSLADDDGATLVGVRQQNGVLRNVRDKLAEVVSIQDYSSIDDLFSAYGGENKTGFGAEPVIVDLQGGSVDVNGIMYVPCNIGFKNGTFRPKSGSGDRIVFRNPWISGQTGKTSYTDFWPYMKAKNSNVNFNCIVVLNCYIYAAFNECHFSGLVMVNSNSLWTEWNSFSRCNFGGSAAVGAAIKLDGNSSGASAWSTGSGAGTSDGSFGYNNWEPNCVIDSSAPVVGIHVTGGGVLYNAHLGFQGYARGTNGAWLWIEAGAVNQCKFEIHLESFGAASNAISLEAGARMWYNDGFIVSASPEIGMLENGTVDLRSNNIRVVGCKLYAPDNSSVFNGAGKRSLAIDSIMRRRYDYPSFSVYASAGLTFTSNANAVVPLAGVEFGAEYMNGNKFSPKVAGNYSINARVGLTVTAYAQVAWIGIAKNGTVVKTGDANNPDGKTSLSRSVSAVVSLNGTTDYIEIVVFVFDNSGAPVIQPGDSTTYCSGSMCLTF